MSVFPQIQDDLTVEMDLGGTWTDVTSYVYTRDPLTISRGRSDEASQVDPSRLTMTLDNRTGRFSPRNPLGAYYGLIGRNTPVRVSTTRVPGKFMELPGTNGDMASAPDATALGITGDIDVRIDLTTSYWTSRDLCGKYVTATNQRSWAVQTNGDGTLVFRWSPDGTVASALVVTSTLPLPTNPGRRAVRVTLDVNNGASGNTTTFYTSDSISGSWTQLGTAVVLSGTTSIFDSTSAVEVGDNTGLTAAADGTVSRAVAGEVHAFQLRSGIAGTVVANPDFTAQAAGATSFADTAGTPNTWTLQGSALLTNRRWRFHGEMATLPSRWDVSGRDVYVPAEAAGITRRLGAAGTPLRSAIYRAILTEAGVVSYWPCEDGSDSKAIASGLPLGRPMTPSSPPGFGGSDVFEASEALPTVSNTSWSGPVAVYTPTSTAQVRWLQAVPSTGTTNNAVIIRILTTGTAARWEVFYSSTFGQIGLKAFDADGNSLLSDSAYGPINGFNYRMSFELTQSGSNINYVVQFTEIDSPAAGGFSGTVTGRTFSRIKTILIDPTNNIDDTTIGHISVHSQITSIFDLIDELAGWDGETAGRRIERLCAEEGITFRGIGDLDDTTALGVQRPGALLDLLRECEDADLGTLFEPREVLGIGYRTRASLYNQDPAVAFDYANGELSDSLNPVPDDQNIHNSVTVSRSGGGSARVDITDGPLSTQAPPDGVGTYSDQPSVSLYDDEQCAYQASWRAHLGTVDEDRYPQVSVNFAASQVATNATLVRQLLEQEVGDRLTVAHPPSWLPPDAISQLVQGYAETFTAFAHDMTLNCSPASPYEIAVYGTDRYDTAGSQLASSATSTATSLSVATTLGPLWTTDPADLPFDLAVGGEQVRVINTSTRITDTFTRSASSSWGTADTGQSWATSGGSAANYSATGSTGRVSCTDVTTRRFTSIGSAITDAAVIVSATTPVTAATDTITAGIVLRYTDDNNTYLAQVSFNPSGTVTLEVFKRVAGTFTSLGSQVDVTRYTPGVAVRIRAACVGSQISARVWTAGTPEPPWQVTASDAAFTSGKVGTKTSLGAGNTNTLPVAVDYDDLDMLTPAITGTSSPQTFTVVRSVNGLVKAHASGDDVRLYSPTYREL